MADQSSDEDFKPLDYVYIGRRQLRNGKIGHFIRRLNDAGELDKEIGYGDLKKFSKVVGGVYTGATFIETHAKGIESAKYNRQWPDVMNRLEWQALDRNTEMEMKRERIEKDARRTNEMDTILLPIRRAIYNANRRGDYTEAQAIRVVVQISLNKPLTQEETE